MLNLKIRFYDTLKISSDLHLSVGTRQIFEVYCGMGKLIYTVSLVAKLNLQYCLKFKNNNNLQIINTDLTLSSSELILGCNETGQLEFHDWIELQLQISVCDPWGGEMKIENGAQEK